MPPRMLDLTCTSCGAEVDDLFVMRQPSRIVHLECGGEMEQVYRLRPRSAQWGDKDAITVFRKPDGSFSYPACNDKPTPPGMERITIKSHAELRRFEREAGVVAHVSGYDSKSPNAIDDERPAPRRESEHERFERFRRATQGVF